MPFRTLYNKLTMIYGTLTLLLVLWIVLMVVGFCIGSLFPSIFISRLVLFVFIILGLYLSVKIIRWTTTSSEEDPGTLRGEAVFNAIAFLPSIVVAILVILVIWIVVFAIIRIAQSMTGLMGLVVTIIGVVLGVSLTWIYIQGKIQQWKPKSEE